VNNKRVKTNLILLLFFLSIANYSRGDGRIESAIAAFQADRVAYENDKLLFFQVDFRGDGNPAVFVAYSVTDYFKHVGHIWTVLELKDGAWVDLKALSKDGKLKNYEVTFDETAAGFVMLNKYKHRGILTYNHEQWWFTYLKDGILKTVHFENAADAGLSEDELKKMVLENKIAVQRRPTQQ
jgi:hypothetical protein